MKKSFLSFVCCVFIFLLQAQNNQWTWTAGENNYIGYEYGTKGVADSANFPRARAGAATWVGASGDLWMFGGLSNNALWKYSPATHLWTWVSGDSTTTSRAVYGTKGTAAPANTPSGAASLLSWKDAAGRFWLYSTVLWRYDPLVGQWTWINGDTSSTKAIYGTKGIAAPANKPGSTISAEWTDTTGNFWFYGRVIWKYDVAADVWTWMQGDTTAVTTVHGKRGIPANSNTPGARSGITVWTDTAGKFWLFGGVGTVSTPYLFRSINYYTGPLNDLWKYDPLTNQWTWMHGDTTLYMAARSGTKGVAAPGNTPGCRSAATSWKDAAGNFWLFGGYIDNFYISQIPYTNPVGDLWKYNPATNLWAFFGSNSTTLASRDSFDVRRVESPATLPAQRYGASGWTDPSGNLWMFGGTTLDYYSNLYYFSMNDLLKYNPNTNMWSLEQEHRSAIQWNMYGTKGVAGLINRPSGRYGAASCTDKAGNLWFFGGLGYQQTGNLFYYLNDLWKQDTAKLWTWMGNSTLPNSTRHHAQMWADTSGKLWIYGGNYPVSNNGDLWKVDPLTFQWTQINGNVSSRYGTKGQPAATNRPGRRTNAVTWTDKTGRLWMFGGDISFSGTGGSSMNDTWSYDPATGWWTWISGDSTAGQPAVFGTPGMEGAANKPGGREGAVNWIDTAGNTWVFGGLRQNTALLNDLWKYNPVTNQWTWMNGDSAVNRSGVYGTKGVANAANKPGSRYDAVAWTDTKGKFWLFGGARMVNSDPYIYPGFELNDLWFYDPALNAWTWVSGDSLTNQNGWYGRLGIADSSNKPGARVGAAGYTDKAGNFRLIGGAGYGWKGRSLLNDEWTFSPLTATTLPVRFFDFSATAQGREALLQWSASAAQAGAYYIIERSRDGVQYDSIGMVRAAGGSSATNTYLFTDRNAFLELNYYRIIQKEPDGRFTYSTVVKLWFEHAGWSYAILPNPVSDELKVSFQSGRAAVTQLSIRDAAGHVLISRQQPVNSGPSVYTVGVKSLAAGTYFLSIAVGKTTVTKKFVKR